MGEVSDASSRLAQTFAPSLAPALSSMLEPGLRVRMNALGRERHPRYGLREGIILGRGSPSSWRVQFDDRRSVQAIHQSYLECAPESANRPPRDIRHKRSELMR